MIIITYYLKPCMALLAMLKLASHTKYVLYTSYEMCIHTYIHVQEMNRIKRQVIQMCVRQDGKGGGEGRDIMSHTYMYMCK